MANIPALSGPPSGLQDYTNSPLPPLSWDGEKMFNLYIYDYCFKRGFRKTARELLIEADIPAESRPPINARQGLLYEWWSVFWVLFQARSTNIGVSEDACFYNMHMKERHEANPPTRSNPSIPGAPSAVATSAPPQRLPMSAGVPNGTGPVPGPSYGQPQIPPAGSSMSFTMGGAPGPQVNGVPGSHPPTPGGGPTQAPVQGPHSAGPHPGGPQQAGFHPMMQQQRQMNGPQPQGQPGGPLQAQQQRSMAGPPFQSPTLAASSPSHGNGMPPPQQPSGPQQPPMGNLGGPSPLMNRPGSMLPPNGAPQGMIMPSGPMSQNGTPSQQFQQIPNNGRPPSRTNTPQVQGGMVQQSPSLANRQLTDNNAVNMEFSRLTPQMVAQLKAETELNGKDVSQFTIQDKKRILQQHYMRARPANATPGPSNPGAPTNQPVRPPQQPQQRVKRPSTSPGEDHDTLPRNESSPPERKRPRRSPTDNASSNNKPSPASSYPQTPQQAPAIPPPQPPQGQPGQLPMAHPGLQPGGPGSLQPGMIMVANRPMGPPGPGGPMQGQMMMNGHIPPPPMMQGQPMQGQPMQGMNPQAPMGHPSHLGMMMPNQMGPRVPLHQVHNMQQQPPLNAGSPAGADPSFNPGSIQGPPGGPHFNPNLNPNSLMAQQKPPGRPGGNMMPPPSPANASKDPKDIKTNPDRSPAGSGPPQVQSNAGPPQSTPTPQIPPGTPVGQTQQHSGNPGPPPPPQTSVGNAVTSPMPNNLMGGSGSGPNPMSSLNNSLAGLDGSIDNINMFDTADFNISGMSFEGIGENGFDFARDFGQWFNPDDSMSLGTDSMK